MPPHLFPKSTALKVDEPREITGELLQEIRARDTSGVANAEQLQALADRFSKPEPERVVVFAQKKTGAEWAAPTTGTTNWKKQDAIPVNHSTATKKSQNEKKRPNGRKSS